MLMLRLLAYWLIFELSELAPGECMTDVEYVGCIVPSVW